VLGSLVERPHEHVAGTPMSTLLLVVLVAAGEANHPATLGAASSARQLLGTDLEVEVRELPTVPSDESARAMGTALHAAAVVELVWDTAEHRQAKIRFHLDRRDRSRLRRRAPPTKARRLCFGLSPQPNRRRNRESAELSTR
jgi:hypothetical protein